MSARSAARSRRPPPSPVATALPVATLVERSRRSPRRTGSTREPTPPAATGDRRRCRQHGSLRASGRGSRADRSATARGRPGDVQGAAASGAPDHPLRCRTGRRRRPSVRARPSTRGHRGRSLPSRDRTQGPPRASRAGSSAGARPDGVDRTRRRSSGHASPGRCRRRGDGPTERELPDQWRTRPRPGRRATAVSARARRQARCRFPSLRSSRSRSSSIPK